MKQMSTLTVRNSYQTRLLVIWNLVIYQKFLPCIMGMNGLIWLCVYRQGKKVICLRQTSSLSASDGGDAQPGSQVGRAFGAPLTFTLGSRSWMSQNLSRQLTVAFPTVPRCSGVVLLQMR